MSSTNKTSHYELSQFIGTDKPAWLTDYNSDMLKIDTWLAAAAAEASGAQDTATSAASAAQAAQNTANQAVTSAQANAEGLTELKAELTNTVETMTRLGNADRGSCVISYSGYVQNFNLLIGWTELPNNTSIYESLTRIPVYSVAGNIFKIATSTITDNNSKIYLGQCNGTVNTSSLTNASDNFGTYAYYDGSNTIIYIEKTTTVYQGYIRIVTCLGNLTTLFSGNFVNITD